MRPTTRKFAFVALRDESSVIGCVWGWGGGGAFSFVFLYCLRTQLPSLTRIFSTPPPILPRYVTKKLLIHPPHPQHPVQHIPYYYMSDLPQSNKCKYYFLRVSRSRILPSSVFIPRCLSFCCPCLPPPPPPSPASHTHTTPYT